MKTFNHGCGVASQQANQATYLPEFLGRNIQLDVKARFIVKGRDLCREKKKKKVIKALCLVCYVPSNKLFTCGGRTDPVFTLFTFVNINLH